MRIYQTAEIAAAIGVHPNTVRLYEELGLIPPPARRANGYRVFTETHLRQFRLARLAFQIEVLQNGLRKKMVRMVKTAAAGDFDAALCLTHEYLAQVRQERTNAEEAARIAQRLLCGALDDSAGFLKRKEVSRLLNLSMDTLRNWEMNGLLSIKRKENGYRLYSQADIRRLKLIRSLRCANYSLEAILHMLLQLEHNPEANVIRALDTPNEDSGIVAVCDRLVTSLLAAEANASRLLDMLLEMKRQPF